MKSKKGRIFFSSSCTVLLACQALFLCASPKIKITATIYPLAEFAKAVSGKRGDVTLFLPPGAEIHTWRPRPTDIIKLSSADLFVYVGADLEPWLGDILKSVRNPHLKVLEASKGLSLIKGEEEPSYTHEIYEKGAVDPHIWLDFENDRKIVDTIESFLSEIDPASSALYRKNAAAYKERLEELDHNYRETLKNCSQKTLILSGHAAFGYLARRYDFQQVSLYGLNPDSTPTPKQLVEVIKLMKAHNIQTVFFEEYVRDKLAKVISREVGAKILALNPGVNLTAEELKSGVTFFDIMKKNLENLKDGLACR